MGIFDKIKHGLEKTRNQLTFIFKRIDDEMYDELEEQLIIADVGAETSAMIVERLRQTVKEQLITNAEELPALIKGIISDIMHDDTPGNTPGQRVVLVIGVNGAGKTTSIGKLTNYYKSQKQSVLLAAADTFRAAAINQLAVWAERSDTPIIRQMEGTDPAAVVFDAVNAARARNVDILICDTAGRLHNKKHLMDELVKISKIIDRELPDAQKEVLLVLDATTGQNALAQAKLFNEATHIDGIILTKLDGTAKGGIVVAIKAEQSIPVKFIGIGEGIEDLVPFHPEDFVNAIFE